MKNTYYNKELHWLVKDEDLQKAEMLYFEHSKHSIERACQRNINARDIETAIEYGTAFFKQGLIFYVFGKNNLSIKILNQQSKKCSNLVVVVAGDSNTILTCYRSSNPFKHIKKKQKHIGVKFNNAA